MNKNSIIDQCLGITALVSILVNRCSYIFCCCAVFFHRLKGTIMPFFFLISRISSSVYETFNRFMTCWIKFSVLGFVLVTDHELRCDVKVDVINSIEIISRTRELYVDDSPLELMVRALDAEGNECQRIQRNYLKWTLLCLVFGNRNLRDKSRLEIMFIFSYEVHVQEELTILSVVWCINYRLWLKFPSSESKFCYWASANGPNN